MQHLKGRAVFLLFTLVQLILPALVAEAKETPTGLGFTLTNCSQAPIKTFATQTTNVEEDFLAWGTYCEGLPTYNIEKVTDPVLDGEAIRLSLTGGEPYSNVHIYAQGPLESEINELTLSLSFYFTPPTTFNNEGDPSVIQALEFSMSKWQDGIRYEIAWQIQFVGDGAPQWCYWEVDDWVCPGITSPPTRLAGEQWHNFSMIGEIINGKVHYSGINIDGFNHPVDITVASVKAENEPDRIACAFQADGNATQTPYAVIIDQVDCIYGPGTEGELFPIFLPLIIK